MSFRSSRRRPGVDNPATAHGEELPAFVDALLRIEGGTAPVLPHRHPAHRRILTHELCAASSPQVSTPVVSAASRSNPRPPRGEDAAAELAWTISPGPPTSRPTFFGTPQVFKASVEADAYFAGGRTSDSRRLGREGPDRTARVWYREVDGSSSNQLDEAVAEKEIAAHLEGRRWLTRAAPFLLSFQGGIISTGNERPPQPTVATPAFPYRKPWTGTGTGDRERP